MRFMTFDRTRYGWRIKADDGLYVHYIGYTARAAEQEFRRSHGLRYKHFTKIYI